MAGLRPGHPRSSLAGAIERTWMPGTSARSKRRRLARARRLWPSRHRTRVVSPSPHTHGKCGERRNIIRSDDGRASGSRSLIPDETQSGFASGAKTSDPSQQHRRRDIIGIHMKKIILATVLAGIGSTSALAADLGARAPYSKAPAMVAVSNWSGFYIGGNVGYGWGNGNTDLVFLPTPVAFGVANTSFE